VITEVEEELNQTEELKSEDMSAFTNNPDDDSGILKYSNRPSNIAVAFDKN
jgi:hypothetical protein